MNEQAGFFVAIEGPSGVGKSTVTDLLHAELAHRGLLAVATKEPSDSALGKLARLGTNEYRGVALACLVAADRYYHLAHDIDSRFHHGGTAARVVEDRLYRDVVHQLREAGHAVLHHEV